MDEIALTLPADDAFQRVAHLVLGGFADRHDLTVETLDDLTLALDTVLERYGESQDEVTVRVRLADDTISTSIGPFADERVRDDLEHGSSGELDLRRILTALCDHVGVAARDGGHWVELTKHVDRVEGAAA